jgi:hypothetical protein
MLFKEINRCLFLKLYETDVNTFCGKKMHSYWLLKQVVLDFKGLIAEGKLKLKKSLAAK